MKSLILLLLVALAAMGWILATTCGVAETAAMADTLYSEADDWLDYEAGTAPSDAEFERAPAPASPELAAELSSRRIPPPRSAIHGLVLQADGAAAEGAMVRLWALTKEPADEPVASTRSSASGGFSFDGPLLGDYRVAAEHGGITETRFPIPAGDFVEIRLGSGCRIEGSIHCSSHEEESFAGSLWLTAGYFESLPLMTAAIQVDGTFTFGSIPPGSYTLAGKINGHVFNPFQTLNLTAWGETVSILVETEAGLVLEGRVLDELTNRPIAGANVMVGPMNRIEQLTDEDGRFRIAEITPRAREWGEMVMVYASASDYVSAQVPFEPEVPCLLRLKPAAPLPLQITGRILDHRQKPVAGLRLMAEGRNLEGENRWMITALRRQATTGSTGDFRLEWDKGLSTTISIESDTAGTFMLHLGTVNADRQLHELQLPVPASWDLRFTDESGQPVAGAVVSRSASISWPQEVDGAQEVLVGPLPFTTVPRTTDSYGRCRLVSSSTEDLVINVTYGTYGQWFFSASSPDGPEQIFVLDNLRRITGSVKDSAGRPYADAVLLILNPEDEQETPDDFLSRCDWYFLSQAGTFRIEGCYPREVTLLLQLHGTATGIVRRDAVALDAGPIVMVVPELVACTGQVQDAAGQPLANVRVLAMDSDDQQHPICRSDAAGRFSVGILPDARVRLFAQDAEQRRSELVEIRAGSTSAVLQIKQ